MRKRTMVVGGGHGAGAGGKFVCSFFSFLMAVTIAVAFAFVIDFAVAVLLSCLPLAAVVVGWCCIALCHQRLTMMMIDARR